MSIYLALKESIKKLNATYLKGVSRKVEFLVYLVSYIIAASFLSNTIVPDDYKGAIAVIQSFIAFFLAFRFRYFGLCVALFLNVNELRIILGLYLQSHRPDLFIGLFVKSFGVIAITFIAVLSQKQEIQRKLLQQLSLTDELTGIFNQRFFHTSLTQEIARANKDGGSVGLIVIDIDDFKIYNDVYGHDCGDTILKGTGALLKAIIPEKQFVCRCGGDEFAIILADATPQSIEEIAYDFKKSFREQGAQYFPEDLSKKITFSMGLSEYPHLSSSKEELISQADMALYHAKNLGKDKVHFYQDVLKYIRKSIGSNHQQLIGVFKALLSAISAKDKYTLGHSERVSAYAVAIGEALGLNYKEITILQYAGLLHDIGKIEIPMSLLNKIEPLTGEEFEQIRMHPVYSENILEPLDNMSQLRDYVRRHHERFDGGGYPDGIKGDQISLGARILCVADSFDAMISERPYRRSMTEEQAILELKNGAGTQFDPEIVQVFIGLLQLDEPEHNHQYLNSFKVS
ncbi:MAG TPA: diguanylate cyclase [Bacillota bacterium]|nr:diguanylate cyclase [Bacillota bacterium]